jgi:hypothetical protein
VKGEPTRSTRRRILVVVILGTASAVVLSLWVVPWARDRSDPLWRVRRAFDEIEVPEPWRLVHQEEVEERFLTPWGGAVPNGKRIYLVREEPIRACRTSDGILAAWSSRRLEKVRVAKFPNILYRCQSFSEKDEVVATFTVWDRDGWRSELIKPDLRHSIGDGILVVELYVVG